MSSFIGLIKHAKFSAAALALIFIAGMPAAKADEAQARALFKTMSDYLAKQQMISFDLDTTLEVVSKDQQKVAFASSGEITLSRPDKLRGTRHGGFANVEFVFDGKTMSLLGKDIKLFLQIDVPGTIDNLVDVLRTQYQRPVPAADLLSANVYEAIMPYVTDVKDLGSGVIRGVECDHFAFRTPDVDLQIWITQGEHPYPRRYTLSSSKITGSPQYTVDVTNWKTGKAVTPVDFAFKAPSDARRLAPGDKLDIDDLPDFYKPKNAGVEL